MPQLSSFETPSVTFQQIFLVSVQAPAGDVDRIMETVVGLDPLVLGKYDSNSFEIIGGMERYRPREGAAAGREDGLRKRPGVSIVSFQLAHDQGLLARVVEAIFQVHSYQEPVIMVQTVLASRSKGLDDSANPHRWWNTTGDWKKSA